MLKLGLQSGLYLIQSIVRESDDLCIYIAKKRGGKQYVCCEVRSLALIDRWITDINVCAQQGRLTCFTEGSFLYILTRYSEGEQAELYFRVNRTALSERLELMKKLVFGLISCADLPDVILRGMLGEQSVCYCKGALEMNCYITADETRSPLELYAGLFGRVFGESDMKKLSYLNIVMQKLQNNVYTDFTQIYLDLERAANKSEESGGLTSKLKAFCERSKSWVKIIGTAAVLIIAAIVMVKMLTKKSEDSVADAYTPIDHIGTVSIAAENAEVHEIHISKAD